MFSWIAFIRCFSWGTVKKTIACVIQKRLTGLAAEMAFHAVLGLFPAIIAILSAVSLFEKSVELILIDLAIRFADIVPIQVWKLLIEFVTEIRASETKSWFSFSSIFAVWIISGVLGAAINALDRIHQVAPQDKRSYLQTKAVAMYLTALTIVFLILACFLLWVGDFLLDIASQQSWNLLLSIAWKISSIIIAIAIMIVTAITIAQFQTRPTKGDKSLGTLDGSRYSLRDRDFKSIAIAITIIVSILLVRLVYAYYLVVENMIVDSNLEIAVGNLLVYIWRVFGFPIALGLVTIAFSLIYQHGPSIRIKNAPVFPGAILAAISWAIVSLLFRLYVFHIGIYNKIYGAVGTVVILMLWLYLSSLVMLIGEQVNVILGEALAQNALNSNKRLPPR